MAYSSKENVLQLAALLAAFQIKQVILSPGSRNAPLIQTFSQHPYFQCHVIVDERNAAFFALGIIQKTRQPAVICCTSGSALLNYMPAVAEAYYQRLPLIVVSADRSLAWIGQMDGQTLPQQALLKEITQYQAQLPEVHNEEEKWFCNRLINEALIAVTAKAPLPIHINIPLAEPLFDYSTTVLPACRKIDYHKQINSTLMTHFQQCEKIMVVVGQLPADPILTEMLTTLAKQHHCVIVAEQLANQHGHADVIQNVDTLLAFADEPQMTQLQPELLITFGGHLVSKRLKQFLRKHKPTRHWHLSEQGDVIDLFQALTDVIADSPHVILQSLCDISSSAKQTTFLSLWQRCSQHILPPVTNKRFSDLTVIDHFVRQLPKNAILHVANSSAVRHLGYFSLDPSVTVYCNRGINGIEGTLSTAMGFAAVTDDPVYLLIGDLSFFYNVGALWNSEQFTNLRILLINNSSGGIFHLLPGLTHSASLEHFVSASHQTQAKKWAAAAGFDYYQITDTENMQQLLPLMMQQNHHRSMIIEAITTIETTQRDLSDFYQKSTIKK